MISDIQNLQNLGSASRLAMYHLGLDLTPVAEWSDVDMVSYLEEFKNIILAHPESFNEQSMITAHYVDAKNMQDLLEPDWLNGEYQALRTMKYELQNSVFDAGDDLASLGRGALNLLGSVGRAGTNVGESAEKATGAASLLIPVIALAVLYIIVNDPARAASATRSYASAGRSLLPI